MWIKETNIFDTQSIINKYELLKLYVSSLFKEKKV